MRESGGSGRRGFAIESAATRVSGRRCQACHQRAFFFERDRLGSGRAGRYRGGRRLEIIADGLPLFGGVTGIRSLLVGFVLCGADGAIPHARFPLLGLSGLS